VDFNKKLKERSEVKNCKDKKMLIFDEEEEEIDVILESSFSKEKKSLEVIFKF